MRTLTTPGFVSAVGMGIASLCEAHQPFENLVDLGRPVSPFLHARQLQDLSSRLDQFLVGARGSELKFCHEITRKSGFYAANPGHEIAVRQLLVRGTPNWKSLRLGQFPKLRSIIDEEIESAWQGRKSPVDALNHAVSRGNAFLDGR